MAKTIKVSIKGGNHDLQIKKVAGDVTDYYCTKCGIRGTKTGKAVFIEVPVTRKNKIELIDNCISELPGEKKQKIEMKLDCKFTDDELRAFGKELSEKYFELGKNESEKKTAMSEFKAVSDSIEDVIGILSTKIKDGCEQRDVECEVHYHVPELNMKRIVRTDTNEVVGEIPMDDEDYTLFNQPEDND